MDNKTKYSSYRVEKAKPEHNLPVINTSDFDLCKSLTEKFLGHSVKFYIEKRERVYG